MPTPDPIPMPMPMLMARVRARAARTKGREIGRRRTLRQQRRRRKAGPRRGEAVVQNEMGTVVATEKEKEKARRSDYQNIFL